VHRSDSEDKLVRSLPGEIDTMLAWRAGGRLLIGRERIALLESVMEHKSITKAAEVMGLATKRLGMPSTRLITCCRAQRLSHAPAARMAAAEVTEEGRRLILAFRRLEEKLGSISTAIAGRRLGARAGPALFGMA